MDKERELLTEIDLWLTEKKVSKSMGFYHRSISV